MNIFTEKILPTLLIIFFLAIYIHPTNELSVDLGEHILKGQLLFQTHKIPTTNIFSYTYPNFHFVSLEWLTETIFYLVNLFLGVNGLIIFSALITLCSLIIIYKYAEKKSNKLLTSYIAVLYLLVLFERSDVLPEIFSFLFLSIFLVLLYKFREKYSKLIWLLIPLQLLWVNMHIYFIVGILLTGLFLFEALVLFRKRDDGNYLKTLLVIFISNFVVSLLNPYGLNGLIHPFVFWQNYALSVSENLSIVNSVRSQAGYLSASVLVFIALSISILLSIILQFRKTRLIDVLILIGFILGGVLAVRDLGLFVIATFIPFIFVANSLLEKYNIGLNEKLHNLFVIFLPIIIVVLSIWVFSQLGKPGLGSIHKYNSAIDFFVSSKLNGPIFNNYDIGSYLAYRLYPKDRVFVDTRPEAYPANFFNKVYLPMLKNQKDFQNASKKYGFNTIVYGYGNGLPQDMGFIKYLMQSKEWQVVYIDDSTLIFVKDSKNNERIVRRYSLNDNNFRLYEYASFDSLFNLAHFLDEIGWKKSEIVVNQKLNEIDPKNCEIMRNLIVLLGQENPTASEYLGNYRLHCIN